ncbi:MAG: hypothetical protein M1830_005907 [Pleopsidium flavum]|nr:MAG: hypothetical protein M1830_005907 [Pleopsidium flavum]
MALENPDLEPFFDLGALSALTNDVLAWDVNGDFHLSFDDQLDIDDTFNCNITIGSDILDDRSALVYPTQLGSYYQSEGQFEHDHGALQKQSAIQTLVLNQPITPVTCQPKEVEIRPKQHNHGVFLVFFRASEKPINAHLDDD